jgi:hypothetical protein
MRGSTVFNAALEVLGRIEDVIIEEPSGRIAFAILQAGGLLGIGAHHYPLRWEKLRFDVEMDGYIVDVRDVIGKAHRPAPTSDRIALSTCPSNSISDRR